MDGDSSVFTFGFDQVDSEGNSLSGCYVVVPGSLYLSRHRMLQRYGRNWAFQYPDEEAAGVKKWNLKRIEWSA